MIDKSIMVFMVLTCSLQPIRARSFNWTQSLDNWCMGAKQPELWRTRLADGITDDCMLFPPGTDAAYYLVREEGEGVVGIWIYESGTCTDADNPGYSQFGPRWGFRNPLGVSFTVGISRQANLQGCRGYSAWSSCAPLEYRWFNDGVRGADDIAWTPGWYKWEINGNWDDISFTLYDVDYDSNPAPDAVTQVHGDVSCKYSAASENGIWAEAFGEGWKGVFLRGDDETGGETIAADWFSATGVFYNSLFDKAATYKCAAGCGYYPAIISVPAGTVFVGNTYNYQVVISDTVNAVKLTAVCTTAAIPFDTLTAAFAWTPTMNDTGLHFVTLEATVDSVPVDWQNFGVRVMEEVGIVDRGFRIADSKTSGIGYTGLYDLRGNRIQRPTGHGIFIDVDEAGVVRKRVW